jgi:putative sigma-54 modulation protein
MKLSITGKHLEITPAIREKLDQKLSKTLQNLDDHTSTHIVLGSEKHVYWVEITLITKGYSLHCKEELADMYLAIDHAVNNIEKQLRKHKNRTQSLNKKQGSASKEIEDI